MLTSEEYHAGIASQTASRMWWAKWKYIFWSNYLRWELCLYYRGPVGVQENATGVKAADFWNEYVSSWSLGITISAEIKWPVARYVIHGSSISAKCFNWSENGSAKTLQNLNEIISTSITMLISEGGCISILNQTVPVMWWMASKRLCWSKSLCWETHLRCRPPTGLR